VLRGVDLVLEAGTRALLGGRNGAGKTTLLRIVAGLVDADAGEVRVAGLDASSDRREYHRRLGYLPAGAGGLYARLTVRQNLDFWGGLALLAGAPRREATARALTDFDLTALEHRRVDRISMGQRQRVRLAATFLHAPDLVLLDEPNTSLDDESLALLRAALDAHHARGGAWLWCAPAVTTAEPAVDVSFVVEDGAVRRA
jgi:heme ABC exporter ATP-binding subunit CcmA